jgi:Fic family protein
MNCYYSNLIEGHDTHPRDIDSALSDDFSDDVEKRNLQLEACAHIEVQRAIDRGEAPQNIVSREFIVWVHREFCSRLPDELLWIENPDTGERLKVNPGEIRKREVAVGKHIPPLAENLDNFLRRFEEAYAPEKLSQVQQVIAVAASHHRFVWIHPFLDGNGRVVRLHSHAYFRQIDIGSSLWSVSRGLARNVEDYKALLMAADSPRKGDLDGRGSLSQSGLVSFCEFFLKTCIDQVEFMASILEPAELLNRMELHVEEEIRAKRLPKGTFPVLREAVYAGEFRRGQVEGITGYKERQAREVLTELLDKKYLVSNSERGPVRLGFPIDAVERWLPRLYPVS